MPCGVKTSGFDGRSHSSKPTGTLTPVPVINQTYTFNAQPFEEALPRSDGPPVHLAPLSELLPANTEDDSADENIRRKSDRITGMDMRFQRFRKAEP